MVGPFLLGRWQVYIVSFAEGFGFCFICKVFSKNNTKETLEREFSVVHSMEWFCLITPEAASGEPRNFYPFVLVCNLFILFPQDHY